jgi:hypothetical protein
MSPPWHVRSFRLIVSSLSSYDEVSNAMPLSRYSRKASFTTNVRRRLKRRVR